MANVVEILIKARDESARAMGQASGRLNKFSDAARRARMSLLAVTGAVTALGVMSIKAGSDLAEQMNRANVVFGESINVVNEFAETSAATFRLTNREAFEYSSVLGRIMQASGFTAAESAKMSVELLKVAGDLSSVSNTPMPQVLAAIQSGLVGEVEPLRRFGVLLSQAALEAKAAELGLAKLGDELTEGQKVTARQAVIIEALSFAQGDAAKTAHSAAGEMAQFRVQNENLRAEIGRFLLPVTAKLLGTINSLMQAFQNASPTVQKIIIGAGFLAAGLAAVGLVLPPLIAGFGVLAAIIGAITLPVAAVGLAIGLLVTGAVLAMTRWKQGTKEAVAIIIDAFFAVPMFVGSAMETAVNTTIEGLNKMIRAAERAFNILQPFSDVQFPTITPWVNTFDDGLEQLRDSIKDVVSEWDLDVAVNGLADAMRDGMPEIAKYDQSIQDAGKGLGAGSVAVGEFASDLDDLDRSLTIGSGGMEDYLKAVKRTTEAADILGISYDEMVAGLDALEAGGASTQKAWEMLGRSLSGQVSADLQAIIDDMFNLGNNAKATEEKVISLSTALSRIGGKKGIGAAAAASGIGAGAGGLFRILQIEQEQGVSFTEAAAIHNANLRAAALASEMNIAGEGAVGTMSGNNITINIAGDANDPEEVANQVSNEIDRKIGNDALVDNQVRS